MPEDGKSIGRDVKSTAKESVEVLLDWTIDYIGPLLLGVIGLLGGSSAWGGEGLFYKVMTTQFELDAKIAAHVAPLPMLAIFGALGGAFWHLGSKHRGEQHIILRAVGKLAGAYFLGVTIAYAIDTVTGATASNGLLDNVFSAVR